MQPSDRGDAGRQALRDEGVRDGYLAVIVPVAGGDPDGVETLVRRLLASASGLGSVVRLWLADPALDAHLEALSTIAGRYPAQVRLVPIHQPDDALRSGLVAAIKDGAERVAIFDPAHGVDLRALKPGSVKQAVVVGYHPGAAPGPLWNALCRALFGLRFPPGGLGYLLFRAHELRPLLDRLAPAEGMIELLARIARAGRLRPSWVALPGTTPLIGDSPRTVSDLLRLHDQIWRAGMPIPESVGLVGGRSEAKLSPLRPNGEDWRAWWLRPRSARIFVLAVSALLLVSLLVHLRIMQTTYGAPFDIQSFQLQASSVFQGQNVYLAPNLLGRYPYPPLWIWLVAGAAKLSHVTGLVFDRSVKLPGIAADLGIVVLMVAYLVQRVGRCWWALVPATIFALNPVAIAITAGHGQFDALVLYFLLLALVLRGPRQDQHALLAALALGIAIALKGYPVLLLPFFALTAPYGRKVLTIIMAFVPLLACMALYGALFGFTPAMIMNVLSYRSTADFGWSFVLRHSGTFDHIAQMTRYLIVVIAALVPGFVLGRRPAAAVAFTFAAFYTLTFDMSVQYLIWIVPFLALAYPLWALIYNGAAFVALSGFYVQIAPQALPTTGRIARFLALLAPWRDAATLAIIIIAGGIMLRCALPLLATNRQRTSPLPP